ncbi:MAG TPA: hypothetical protein VD993_04955 [Chitinophagaceae bacterium]|nr:hypothetical protein [Chitinophagaceae bacterium]
MQFLLLISAVCLIACNAEVNTVNPQASTNIERSKMDNFFIREYYSDSKTISIEEAWIEHQWKNEASLFNSSKVRTTGVQLNIKVNNVKHPDLEENEYFITWQMIVPEIGTIGMGNGGYLLFIDNGRVPDSMKVVIKKRAEDRDVVVDSFNLYGR